MKKFLTIMQSEYLQVVKKKSFLIGVFLTPGIMILMSVLPMLLVERDITTPTEYAIIDGDGRGIGRSFAEALQRYKLDDDTAVAAYHLEGLYETAPGDTAEIDSLRLALDSLLLTKQLKSYVVICPNAEATDSVIMVSKSLSFKTSSRFDRSISDLLSKIRLKKTNINLPVDSVLAMTRHIDMLQASPGGRTRDFMTIYFGALIFVMIIFVPVVSFGQVLMRSVIEEKNSRVIEVILSSASPFQLMMGKIVGLGAANLTQIAIWVALGLVLFSFKGQLNIPMQATEVMFNPILIVFFVLFLVLAYIMYSTLFALVGSICTTDKETQNFVMPITLSLIMPVMFLMYIVQEPDSLTTVVLSLIPLLSPTMMMARLNVLLPESFTFSNPIILEAAAGVVLTALFCLGLIWLTARIFRIGILMYGKRATFPEIMRWIRTK